MLKTQEKRNIRHKRVRAKIFGTNSRPRLYVFRSNTHIYSQLIDDEKAKTLISASDRELKKEKIKSKNREGIELSGKIALAFEVGKLLGQKALEKKIEKIVFDRAGHKYHGRVKALAEGAREAGLRF